MMVRAVIAALLVMVAATDNFAATTSTNDPIKAAAAGRELAEQMRSLRPESSFTNTGTLFIRASRRAKWQVSYTCRVHVTETNWTSYYSAMRDGKQLPGFSVEHRVGERNVYRDDAGNILTETQINAPFAGSDFWLMDLGLEFFYWPEQRVLKWEMKRSFGCRVLESRNPNPAADGYSRVLTWIHEKTGAIIQAEAYDVRGKLWKEFRPTEVEKVNGQHELKEMEIENVRTRSSTRLEFNL